MRDQNTSPSRLPEHRLFAEYVELVDEPIDSLEGYEKARVRNRRAELLAEIGERLEALSAARALLCTEDLECEERTDDGPML